MRSFLEQFKLSKIILKSFVFIIIVLAFLIDGSAFAQTEPPSRVDLSLSPASQNTRVNDIFSVDVLIDGKSNKVSAIDLEINFNPEYLQVQSFSQGSLLPTVLIPASLDNISGKAKITLGAVPTQAPSGAGKIATLQFKAIKNTQTPSKIIVSSSTAVATLGQLTNMLGVVSETGITISNDPNSTVTSASFDLLSSHSSIKVGDELALIVSTTSATDSANLFSAHINFDPGIFEVSEVNTEDSFISQWAVTTFDNQTGLIKLVGGVPAPGIKTPDLGLELATIFLKSKKSGSGLFNFSDNSVIYRNADNADILNSKTPLIVEVAPAGMPSPTPISTPISTPVPTPVPTPTTAAPSSAPSLSPAPCVITNAFWETTGSVTEGTIVGLRVTGSGDCHNKQVYLTVKEDDGMLGTQNVSLNPSIATFDGTNAHSSWISEYQSDGVLGGWPEYFFNAQITGSLTTFKSSNKLTVTKLLVGEFKKGDGDNSGTVDLKDLSVLFSNWNKEDDFPLSLDLNVDGSINAFDFSGLINILKTENLL